MKKNLVALDLGHASLGIALSRSGMFVTPVTNLRFEKDHFEVALAYLHELLLTEKAETFVLGYPTFPSGDPCEMTATVESFEKLLQKEFPKIPIVRQDERYSTEEASAMLHGNGEHAKKQHAHIDCAAACVILERYLDSLGQL